jgi:hypothetical protein
MQDFLALQREIWWGVIRPWSQFQDYLEISQTRAALTDHRQGSVADAGNEHNKLNQVSTPLGHRHQASLCDGPCFIVLHS